MLFNVDKNFIPTKVLKQLLSGKLLNQNNQGPNFSNGSYGGWNRGSGDRGWDDWEIEDMKRPALELTQDGHWRKVNC